MEPELKERWLVALKSGEYKKGKHLLNHDSELCCLGVLCEILELPKRLISNRDNQFEYIYEEEGMFVTLSSSLLQKLNMSSTIESRLSATNDQTETFKEVIKLIEESV